MPDHLPSYSAVSVPRGLVSVAGGGDEQSMRLSFVLLLSVVGFGLAVHGVENSTELEVAAVPFIRSSIRFKVEKVQESDEMPSVAAADPPLLGNTLYSNSGPPPKGVGVTSTPATNPTQSTNITCPSPPKQKKKGPPRRKAHHRWSNKKHARAIGFFGRLLAEFKRFIAETEEALRKVYIS